MNKSLLAATLLAAVCVNNPCRAATVTWDVNVSDLQAPASTLTGFLDYSTTADTITNFSLTGTGELAAYSANPSNALVFPSTNVFFSLNSGAAVGLTAGYQGQGWLSAYGLGTTLALAQADISNPNWIYTGSPVSFARSVTSSFVALGGSLTEVASVSPVPLPAAAPLFALGILGLAALGWRRGKGGSLQARS